MTKGQFEIPLFGIDPNGNIKYSILLNFFQEIADRDALNAHMSVRQLMNMGKTWVLHDYRVEMYEYPSISTNQLEIMTYAEPYDRLSVLRVFEVRNKAGKLMCKAWSWWVLLDMEQGRPVVLSTCEELEDILAIPVEDTDKPERVRIKTLKEASIIEEFKVRWCDLDVNRHTNHVVYFDWALENVPDEIITTMVPTKVECTYSKSVKKGKVRVETEKCSEDDTNITFLHRIIDLSDEKVSAKLMSKWGKL